MPDRPAALAEPAGPRVRGDRSEPAAQGANRRLFTAEEIPLPPAELRRPPSVEGETLFDMQEAEESD